MKFLPIFVCCMIFLNSLCMSLCSAFEAYRKDEVTKKNIINAALINEILNFYAPVSGVVDNGLCRNHSNFYKDSVKAGEMWALKMLDASSKIPSGILMGNTIELGNFDECVTIEDVSSEFGAFDGLYCLVTISPPEESSSTPRSPLELLFDYLRSIDFLKWERTGAKNLQKLSAGAGGSGLSFQVSVCVPSSCRAGDVRLHLQHALPGDVSVEVDSSWCQGRQTEAPLSAADWFAVGFLIFFGFLVVSSTSYDLINLNAESRKPLWAAFSVYTNGKQLLSSPSASSDNLSCLHGIKVITISWVVLLHRYLSSELLPTTNGAVVLEFLQDWKHMAITNATNADDSFFLISGLLVCYVFMRKTKKGTSFNVFLYYIHRYIRLTPPYAVVILLTATLFNYVGDGPYDQANADQSRNTCQQTWWLGLLYVNNYFEFNAQCVRQAWYLAVDMQLFWLSPLVLLPLYKWPRIGKSILGGLFAIGLLIAFFVSYLNEFPVTLFALGDDGPRQYFPIHTRFTPWLIGVALGYILHSTRTSSTRLSKRVLTLGWVLSFGLMLTSWLLAHRFMQKQHQYERTFESLYTCLMRPAWALGVAWVIFACVKGYGGFINTFLSWSVFQILSRLSYGVYLIHFIILTRINASIKQPLYLSDQTIIMQYFGDMVIVFAAAVVLSLVFETPAIIIEGHFLGGLGKNVNRSKEKKIVDEKISQENDMPEMFETDTRVKHVDISVSK